MKKILFFLLITLSITSLSVNPVYSQSVIPEELESCFRYYSYAKVQVSLSSDKSNYTAGEKIKLSGTVVNNNSFPITDIVLYAQLKRENSSNQSKLENGNFLIDRIRLKEDLNFLPSETKYIETEIPVLSTYPGDNYRLEYFIFSKERFHYSGRYFLEEDMAGVTLFSITNNIPMVFFDIDNFRVNGDIVKIKDYSIIFENNIFNFEIPIIDKRDIKTDFEVKVRFFYFEDSFDELLENSQNIIVRPADQTLRTRFALPVDLSAAYVILAEIDQPVKSILKYRFGKNGTVGKEVNIVDLGITNYPPDNISKAYVCFNSPALAASPESEIKLSVLDSQKNTIDSKTIKKTFSPEIFAFSLPLTKLSVRNDFYLKIDVSDQKRTREIIKHYADNMFANSIASIDISHNIENLGEIAIVPKDINGNNIIHGGYIESIRVTDSQGNIVQEKYVITDFDKPFILGELPKGKYTVEVKAGSLKSSKDFELTKNLTGNIGDGYVNKDNLSYGAGKDMKVKQDSRTLTLLFVGLAVTLFGLAGYFIYKKLKNRSMS